MRFAGCLWLVERYREEEFENGTALTGQQVKQPATIASVQ